MKNQKGITLIALVITIIVLIILAGVSIAMLSGENGLLTQAKNVGSESAKGDLEEAVKLAIAEIYITPANNGAFVASQLTAEKIEAQNPSLADKVEVTAATESVTYTTVKLMDGEKVLKTLYVTNNGAVTATQPQ